MIIRHITKFEISFCIEILVLNENAILSYHAGHSDFTLEGTKEEKEDGKRKKIRKRKGDKWRLPSKTIAVIL